MEKEPEEIDEPEAIEIGPEQNTQTSSRNASSESHNSTTSKNSNEDPAANPDTSSSEAEEAPVQEQSWWNALSSVAIDVGAAVVAGVKEEIIEIKEDIETVASASVTAGKKVVEVSQTVGATLADSATEFATTSKEFMAQDLPEFRRVLEEETSESLKDAKDISSKVQTAFGGWICTLSEAVQKSNILTGYPDEGKSTQKINFLNVFDARLHNLRTDTSTYCVEPADEADYELWRETFDLDDVAVKKTISDLLVTSQEMRSLYTKLVPSAVAHQEFWQRYFYKLDALERAERRRTALMERAEKSGTEEDDNLSWGSETDESEEDKKEDDKEECFDENASEKSESPVVIEKATEKQRVESDDWEKEFDIDMTEDEIQAALKSSGGEGNIDDWES